jgi:hypothetical protein
MGKGSAVLESSSQLDLDNMIIVQDLNINVATKYFKKCNDYTKMIERMIQIMEVYKKIQQTQNKTMFVNIILDFEDINYSSIDIEFLKHLIKFFDEKYEYIINIIYCKNVTLLFKMCYKIVRPFLSSDIKQKLKFIKKGSTKILDTIPDNELDEFDNYNCL